MKCFYTIDNQEYEFEIEGNFFLGEDTVLFKKEGNVLEDCEWEDEGFSIINLFSKEEFGSLKHKITEVLKEIIKEQKIPINESFTIENYHKYVKTDKEHQLVIGKTRFLTFETLQLDKAKLIETVAKQLGKTLQIDNPLLEEEIVILRINRPASLDINPFHRDGYLDIWEKVLNVWIPIAGCSGKSSLPVLPGSHYWNEKDIVRTSAKGASINGLTYHVPAILSYKDGLNSIRPNPKYGEGLIFTPFLIHGGAFNTHTDTTRVSLELRLYFNNSSNV
jgi:ectoine hydroxylase-related dioxygenase (phytanoyl-CoA dioxygenase family)